ncbi:hypothetical protein [Methylobacterium persicinum]|uniref:Uncharacterized protein n=1 Tax=Methylobacterium persicinum TaxID=374426 RepID=A0ABU0HEY3_9HYPH|nr:hypothetical protein [Methylobacterium persicinum]MDQ0440888.1 hypothetical protein [Methylobacterium persicinum]
MAARSVVMEHFKSTIATAAIAAFGLLAAAHILHPGNYERTTYPSRPVATVAPKAVSWVNPPATLAVAPEVREAAAAKAEPVPVAWTSAQAESPAPVRTAEVVPEHHRKASAHRRKLSQHPAPVRQAALDHAAQPAAVPAPAAKPQANKIDPIGDIIRGLGLGSDS